MNKLLRAGFRRYAKSPALWIAAAVCAVSSVIGGWQARVNYLDDIYICVVWFAAAILVVLFTGMESGEGIFRNKIATGHTKAVVFLSEWLLAAGVWLLFSLIFAMIFIVFNGYLLDVIPQTVFLRVLADFLLGSVGMATLLTAVNCLITHKILNALVSILLVLGMMYGSDYLQGALYEPEYVTVYEYESIKLEDAEGDVWVPLAVEGSEREEKNPGYISGWMRTVCAAVSGLIPYSHVGERR